MNSFTLDGNFPGGNIVVEQIEDDHVFLQQDLRDTRGDWFYWAFRVRGAAGRTLTFNFVGSDVLGARGPAISLDSCQSWEWLGTNCVSCSDGNDTKGNIGYSAAFSYTFAPESDEVYFAVCPAYTQADLDLFLERNPSIATRKEVLCHSRDGREVEFLHLGSDEAPLRLLLLCRHHACEAMASFCLEGFLEQFLTGDEVGHWLSDNIRVAVVPFMDKDGVEAGDQGKNRLPYDHNRDYKGPVSDSIYPEVKALREWAPQWMVAGQKSILFDLHCPWIRGEGNETVYFVGGTNDTHWQRVGDYSRVLETVRRGMLPFHEANNLPWGQGWNSTSIGNGIGDSSVNWFAGLPGIFFATALEVPYANAEGVAVTPESSRALGRDLAYALYSYLQQ